MPVPGSHGCADKNRQNQSINSVFDSIRRIRLNWSTTIVCYSSRRHHSSSQSIALTTISLYKLAAVKFRIIYTFYWQLVSAGLCWISSAILKLFVSKLLCGDFPLNLVKDRLVIWLLQSAMDYVLTSDFHPLSTPSNAAWKLTFSNSPSAPWPCCYQWLPAPLIQYHYWMCAPYKCILYNDII